MEDLLAKFVAANGPVPGETLKFIVECGSHFLPSWAKNFVASSKSIVSFLESLEDSGACAPAPTTTTSTAFAASTAVSAVSAVSAISAASTASTASLCLGTPAMSACDAVDVSVAGALASFAVQTFVQVVCNSLGQGSDGHMQHILRELWALVVGVASQVREMRLEMHGRFDGLDRKLDVILCTLVKSGAAIERHLVTLETVCMSGFRCVSMDIHAVALKLAALQEMCGDMGCDVTWARLEDTMLDIQLFSARFGVLSRPDVTQLRAWLTSIEDTLLSSRTRASLRWMTKASLLSERHTSEVDGRYFKSILSPLEVVGWLSGGTACFLPFDVYCKVLEVYHSLRLLAQEVITTPPYDHAGVCCRRMSAAVSDVVISSADVAAKMRESMRLVEALAVEQRQLRLTWEVSREKDVMAWARSQEARVQQLAATILHLDNRVCGYTNCNHEEVKWYAVQIREGLRKAFLEDVGAATDPVLWVLSPGPSKEGDTDSILWTNKPFVLKGGNRQVVLDALGPVVTAQRLGWGTLDLVLKVAQFASASWGPFAERVVDDVPWRLTVAAVWNGVQLAEFTVASTHFSGSRVHGMFKTVAGMKDSYGEPHILWDGMVATAFVDTCVLNNDGVLTLSDIDAGKVAALRDRVAAHVDVFEKQKAVAVAVDASDARACIRWLILLGHLPEVAMMRLEDADYQGVLSMVCDRAGKVEPEPEWEWRVPYATFARSLLGF